MITIFCQAYRHAWIHNSTYLGVNTCIESQCMSFKGGSTKPLVVARMGPVAPPEQKVLKSAGQAMMLSRRAAVPYRHGRLFCTQGPDFSSQDPCPYRLCNGTYAVCSTGPDGQDSSQTPLATFHLVCAIACRSTSLRTFWSEVA